MTRATFLLLVGGLLAAALLTYLYLFDPADPERATPFATVRVGVLLQETKIGKGKAQLTLAKGRAIRCLGELRLKNQLRCIAKKGKKFARFAIDANKVNFAASPQATEGAAILPRELLKGYFSYDKSLLRPRLLLEGDLVTLRIRHAQRGHVDIALVSLETTAKGINLKAKQGGGQALSVAAVTSSRQLQLLPASLAKHFGSAEVVANLLDGLGRVKKDWLFDFVELVEVTNNNGFIYGDKALTKKVMRLARVKELGVLARPAGCDCVAVKVPGAGVGYVSVAVFE